MLSRLLVLLTALLGILAAGLVAGCDVPTSHESTRTVTAPSSQQARRATHASHEKKVRNAWNSLRANLRHEAQDQGDGAAIYDDDDDDDDDPDLTTVSIWDDLDIDGSADEEATRTRVMPPRVRDLAVPPPNIIETLRAARGHALGRERPPRA